MNEILEAADFLRKISAKLRFGELSRAPLRLLRLQVGRSEVQCDWLVRPVDPWDMDLPSRIRETNYSHQALRDALKMREFLFSTFRGIRTAELKVFRELTDEAPELLMTGSVCRDDEVPPRIASVVMRAKLSGFQFSLSDGALRAMIPSALQ